MSGDSTCGLAATYAGTKERDDRPMSDSRDDPRRRIPEPGGEGFLRVAKRLTVGLEIFDGHKLGGTGVTLGNGFCKGEEDVFSDRWQDSASLCRYRVVRVSDEDV